MLEKDDVIEDELASQKIQKLLETISGFNDRQVDKSMIEQILKIQKLVKEF